MAATAHVMLLFAIATASAVMATTQDEGENGDVSRILNTMQVKNIIELKLLCENCQIKEHSNRCLNLQGHDYFLIIDQHSGIWMVSVCEPVRNTE